jgi:flavin reductase (DIM6/NTAB) family NADH-FMN oxidoreductase RutF
MIHISVNKAHYTNAGNRENGYFSVTIPFKELVEKTNYVGRVSSTDTYEAGVFSAFYDSVNKAPSIKERPVNTLYK